MNAFFERLAASSARVASEDDSKGRKYDLFSLNIIEEKKFYLDNENNSVSVAFDEKAQEHWRFNNSVPRRVVIHFMNEIKEEDIRELIN